MLTNSSGYIGYEVNSSNNSVLVTDPGSLWKNTNSLYVGYNGASNSLVISNGGWVTNNRGSVGRNGSNNNVRVVDGGIWQNDLLVIGENGFFGQQAPSNSFGLL